MMMMMNTLEVISSTIVGIPDLSEAAVLTFPSHLTPNAQLTQFISLYAKNYLSLLLN
jgi:hypothetical protein